MPLAVMRTTASALPMTFTLDDSMSMTPQMRLSNYPEVVVTARVSKSGSATAQSGDLQGRLDNVSTDDSQGLQLVIDEVVP
jgi:cytochrome c-type biogenesis protein CcmH